jgi:hypothetical protein
MSVNPTSDSAESLFREALRSPNNLDLLERVRIHAGDILAGLESPDEFGPSDDELSDIDEAWLAACYDALAVSKLSLDVEEEFYATGGDEESVGRAFSQGLMTVDRKDIQRFDSLASLPPVEREEQEELLSTPSAKGAGSYALPLARVGLTPLSMFYATESVSYLIERLVDQDLLPVRTSILFRNTDVLVDEAEHEVLTWDLVVDEIRRLSVCNSETAIGIYQWLIQVAQYRRFVFSGVECDPAEGGRAVRLTSSEVRFDNLYQRWGLEKVKPVFESAVSIA